MAKYETITRVDDSKFEKLPTSGRRDDLRYQQLSKNLWTMFHIPFSDDEMRDFNALPFNEQRPLGTSVSDYGWTPAVRDFFYSHPYHAAFVRRMRDSKNKHRQGQWGMWSLSTEPSLVDEKGETVNE